MFEEGNRLKSIHGDDNVFDLSLGNPLLEPPSEFKNKLIEIIKARCITTWRNRVLRRWRWRKTL